MNRAKLFIYILFIITCVAAPLIVHIRTHQRQVDRERALQQQKERLSELSATRDASPGTPQQSARPSPLSGADHVELLQLRSEVGRLRRETNSISQLQEDNRRLAAQPAASNNPAGEVYLRESLAFAGYATPEATLQSFVWGMTRGNRKAILGGIAGQVAEEIGPQLARISDADLAGKISSPIGEAAGFRIIAREALPDDEMLLQFAPVNPTNANTRKPIIKLKKFDGEWKLISFSR